MRRLNQGFLDYLTQKLKEYAMTTRGKQGDNTEASDRKQEAVNTVDEIVEISDDIVHEFVDGAWRDVAIQIHFSGASRNLENLMHFDHVFSSLHMAVTLNGTRTVGFGKKYGQTNVENHLLHLAAGDVYCTTPAGILHGVCTDVLQSENRSVALQCRTLLGSKASKVWNAHTTQLCIIVSKALLQHPIHLPTYTQYEAMYNEMLSSSVVDAATPKNLSSSTLNSRYLK